MKIAALAAFYIASVAAAFAAGASLPAFVSEIRKLNSEMTREKAGVDELAARVERLRQRCYDEQPM